MIPRDLSDKALEKARTNNEIRQLKGEPTNMGDIFDTIEEKATKRATIQNAKKDYKRGRYTTEEIISDISDALSVSYEQAKEIFEKEIVGE